jgi:hypothetical protein
LVLASLAWPTVAGAAGGRGRQVVADGQVVSLPSDEPVPAAALTLPALAGLSFWAPSVRAAISGSFTTAQGRFVAPPGEVLVFVALDSQVFTPPFGSIDRGVDPPSLTLDYGGVSVLLPQSPSGLVSPVAGSDSGDQGSQYDGRWLVAVPAGSNPVLRSSEAGFSQADDVRSGLRVGAAPAVLYRDRSGPLGLDLRPSLSAKLDLTTTKGPVVLPVTLSEAVLSYFRLDETAGAPSGLADDRAYLLVQVTVGSGDDSSSNPVVLAGGRLTALVAASVSGGVRAYAVSAPEPLYDGADLHGVFRLVVPADVKALTLTVGAGRLTQVAVETDQAVTPQVQSATVTGPAKFSLRFPTPSPLPAIPPRKTATSPPAATTRPTIALPDANSPSNGPTPSEGVAGSTPAASHTGDGGGSDGVSLAERVGAAGAGGVVIVLLGVVVWRRKTVLVAPIPVAAADPADTSAAGGQDPGDQNVAGPPDVAEDLSRPASELTAAAGATGPIDAATTGWHSGAPVQLVVRILGPLVVEGMTGPIRRRAVLRALVALALSYPRPIGGEDLRGLLASSEDAELSATTLRSELSRLRAVLPAGVLPDRGAGVGYVLADGVEVDWGRFQAHASRVRSLDGAVRVAEGLEALRLVRGRVLQSAGWHGIDRTVWEIEASIDRLAADVATTALEQGLTPEAAEAAGLGLRAVPGSPALWRLRLQAAEQGSGEHPATVAARARAETGVVIAGAGLVGAGRSPAGLVLAVPHSPLQLCPGPGLRVPVAHDARSYPATGACPVPRSRDVGDHALRCGAERNAIRL